MQAGDPAKDDNLDDLGFESSAFETLEQDFQQVCSRVFAPSTPLTKCPAFLD